MVFWQDKSGYKPFLEYLKLEQNRVDIDTSKYDSVYTLKNRPIHSRLLELTREGKWILVFNDGLSAVFIRVKSGPIQIESESSQIH